jgi:hypothetical protein
MISMKLDNKIYLLSIWVPECRFTLDRLLFAHNFAISLPVPAPLTRTQQLSVLVLTSYLHLT